MKLILNITVVSGQHKRVHDPPNRQIQLCQESKCS